MKNIIVATCGACVIAGLAATAQTPYPKPTPTTQSTADSETLLTVVGCLKYWDGATDRKPSVTPSGPVRQPASGPIAKYMISNIESRNQTGGVLAASYALMGDSTVNLAGHVNHKVQLSGRPVSDVKPADAADTWVPTLRVTEVKMLESTCT
jgi:hypothetical protein